jgi:hypothetical protein
MPVILLPEDEDEWLNPDISELERLLPLVKQFPDNTMEAYPLSYAVNIPKSDSPELITIQGWGVNSIWKRQIRRGNDDGYEGRAEEGSARASGAGRVHIRACGGGCAGILQGEGPFTTDRFGCEWRWRVVWTVVWAIMRDMNDREYQLSIIR